MDKKRAAIIACIIVCGLFLFFLGPMNVFTHGSYPEEVDVSGIASDDIMGRIKLNDENCSISFSPQKNLFAGLELYLVNLVPENGGTLIVKVADSSGRQIDEIEIDLSNVQDSVWYMVHTNAKYQKGQRYSATFEVSETKSVPSFLLVNKGYLGDENIDGNILISYAYGQSTFSFQEKVLIFLFIIAFLVAVLSFGFTDQGNCKLLIKLAVILLMTTVMSWNYMYNSFDNQNIDFPGFQSESETLATGIIYASRDRIRYLEENEKGYGLGRYFDLKGGMDGTESYLTDDKWFAGYNRSVPAIIVNSNTLTKEIAVVGNFIRFKNGEEYIITKIIDDESTIQIYLDAERTLTLARNGSLDDCAFFDMNHKATHKSLITAYVSQYGLQGKVFRRMARHMDKDQDEDKDKDKTITNLNLICALATASVLVLIVLLLRVKYNALFGGCFYITFALSPWVVNFARNLYWVEFTWFIPMAVGIICSLKIDSRRWRLGCYLAAFISITGKCLCGYEYISVVMMGLVSFMVIDLLVAMVQKDRNKAKLLFRTVLFIGIIALAGFMTAISMHARLKGGGNIVEGIQIIIKDDVLRRTNGADLNEFDPVYWQSINASVWEVFCKYFHFSTEIITGIAGNLFPLLCVTPIVIFAYEYKRKQCDFQSIFMYIFFFLASISWFCLAKSHSYIHGHINYVLWYFGFVQTCFYVIVSRILSFISTKGEIIKLGTVEPEAKKQDEITERKNKK